MKTFIKTSQRSLNAEAIVGVFVWTFLYIRLSCGEQALKHVSSLPMILLSMFVSYRGPRYGDDPTQRNVPMRSSQSTRHHLLHILTRSLCALALLLSFGVATQDAQAANKLTLDKVIDGIQAFYKNTQDLRTDFRQIFSPARFSRKQKEKGRFFYRKPSMMRFQYTAPERKDFIYNGSTLWMYYPDDAEVKIKKGIKRSELGVAFQFLWGSGNLKKSFKVKRLPSCRFSLGKRKFNYKQAGQVCLRLIPRKPQSMFKTLYFGVSKKDFRVQQILYVDNARNCNHFILGQIKTNKKLPARIFKFDIPKGTEVIKLP
ncbi:MAG TPA: hypothetical protein DCE42_09735 [Myxococcales bacterium]|nr:hypothetical protein [Deltaproteobacteria bacterium]HAA55028.1 hypothetical protein [Myxococcales bacterium]